MPWMFDLAVAVHARRSELAEAASDLIRLREAIASPTDLSLAQWLQLYATTLAYQPSLVLELGRGLGNSTTVFTAAATKLPATRVVSIGYDVGQAWRNKTAPELKPLVGDRFFSCLDVRNGDIRDVDFGPIVGDAGRVILWWDAHGADLGWFVLGELLPTLAKRDALVCVHDVSDSLYEGPTTAYHRHDGMPIFWLGDIVSPFQEIYPLVDFLSRNRLDYSTPLRSLAAMRERDEPAWRQLNEALEPLAVEALREGGWLYFELDGAEVFPRYTRDPSAGIDGEQTGTFARMRSRVASVSRRAARR